MTDIIQPSLFDQDPSEEIVADVDRRNEGVVPDFSGKVAARVVEYDDRTSEAARDQGWGPVDLPSRTEAAPVGRHVSHPLEMPRQGRTNGQWLPTSAEVRKGLSDSEIERRDAINKAGAASAKEQLKK